MKSLRPSSLHSALLGVISSAALIASLHVAPARAVVPNYLVLSQAPAITAFKGIAPNIIFMLDDSGSMQFEFLGSQGYLGQGSLYNTLITYGFPLGDSKPYGNQTYSDIVPGFEPKNIYGAQFRNSFVNPNYYNPSVTYTPWACPASYPENAGSTPGYSPKVGGSCQWNTDKKEWLWPSADPGKAYLSPYVTSAGFRSLNVWNDSIDPSNSTKKNGYVGDFNGTNNLQWRIKFRGNYQWWSYPYPAEINNDGNPVAYGFWPATYFTYDGPRSGPSQNTDVKGIGYYTRIQICPQATLKVSASDGNGGTKKITGCIQPAALPSNIGTNNYNRTYIATTGNYTDPQGQPLGCGTGANACYVHVNNNGLLVVRSYTQELQNFANWYQYYRSHILLARAGTSQAFMGLPNGFRVDYSLLNHMAKSNKSPQSSTTNSFDTAERQTFLNDIFATNIPAQGTPSRKALVGIGKWLSQTPTKSAPWGTSPAESKANNGAHYLSCRQNYLVFVTDGGWNGGNPSIGNTDNKKGKLLTGPNGASYQYSAAHPYKDSYSDTFADVAFKYWETDLQSNLSNDVPTSGADPGFWQHLVTFDVGLGVTPSLITAYQLKHPGTSTAAAQAAVYTQLQSGSTSWPKGSSYKIDDLWHGGVDGHGGFLSASNPTVFAKSLQRTLFSIVNRTQSSSSATVNTQQASEVKTDTQVYFSLFHPQNWWGQLTAYSFTHDAQGYLQVANTANWDGSCVLTGGGCPAMGTNAQGQPVKSITVQSPSSRTILSWNNVTSAGIPFAWSALTSTQQASLGNSTTGPALLDYIRGVRSQEQSQSGGTLRTRTSVLADIVNSSPTWVGPPAATYSNTWADAEYPSATEPENLSSAQTYSAFKKTEATRNNIVYVGGNDGMVHGFQAGAYDSSGKYVQATNNGKEVIAFVPSNILANLKNYANPSYTHQYFVDATPGTGDLFFQGAWHTWLVGGMGAGGQAIYVLNITHPSQFSQTNASSLVVKEITPTSLVCTNNAACGSDLGNTFGTPIIRRFHNGDWGVVFGNGYNSTLGIAAIYISLINPTTGAWSTYQLSTGSGPSNDPTGTNRPNGISYVTSSDLDGDHVVDYLYAGDLFGHVWRFDVTSSKPSDWHVSKYGRATATPLYTAVNAAGVSQPITTRVLVMSLPAQGGAKPRVLVSFGTGSKIQLSDQTPITTTAGVQTMYGVWDWNIGKWNTGTTTSGSVIIPASVYQYAHLSGPQTVTRSQLQKQSVIGSFNAGGGTYTGIGTGYRTLTSNPVCWKGSTTCTGGTSSNQKYGWYLDLTNSSSSTTYTGESVVYNPVLALGAIQVNTRILPRGIGLTCNTTAMTGWTMAFNPLTGGAMKQSFFGNDSHKFVKIGGGIVGGVSTGATGSPTVLSDGSKYYDINQSSSASPTPPLFINPPIGGKGGRVTWIELR